MRFMPQSEVMSLIVILSNGFVKEDSLKDALEARFITQRHSYSPCATFEEQYNHISSGRAICSVKILCL